MKLVLHKKGATSGTRHRDLRSLFNQNIWRDDFPGELNNFLDGYIPGIELWKLFIFVDEESIYLCIQICIYSGRHNWGCLCTSGGPKKLLRRKYLYGKNDPAVNFHVMWFNSLLSMSLLRHPLIYSSPLVLRVLIQIISLPTENYLMNG